MTAAAHRSPMLDTVMAAAFLDALMRLVGRRGDRQRVMLPASAVDADELARVILALLRARSNSKLRADGARWKE